MSDVIIPYRFKVLGNTAAALAADTGIPRARELVVETDTGRMKLGDGSTGYATLPYIGTDQLPEGIANLYFTDARVYAAAKAMLLEGDGVTITANDGDMTLTITTGDIYTAVKAMLVPGANVTITPDDGLKTLTIAASGGGGGSGAMTLLGGNTVVGAAVTSFGIAGLDLSAYKSFVIFAKLISAVGSTGRVYLTYNGDNTLANYRSQYMSAGGGVSGARTSEPRISDIVANATITGRIEVQTDVDGYPCARSSFVLGPFSNIIFQEMVTMWNSVANVTQLDLVAQLAGGFGVGSTFSVYGVS